MTFDQVGRLLGVSSLATRLQQLAETNREVRDFRSIETRFLGSGQQTLSGSIIRRDRATGNYIVQGDNGTTYSAQPVTGRGIGAGGRVVLRIDSRGSAFADWL